MNLTNVKLSVFESLLRIDLINKDIKKLKVKDLGDTETKDILIKEVSDISSKIISLAHSIDAFQVFEIIKNVEVNHEHFANPCERK